jgi:hypothetical protein
MITMRNVLFIPLEEVKLHFEENKTSEVKIVVPTAWKDESTELMGSIWSHTPSSKQNFVFESSEFMNRLLEKFDGPFSISFANEKAPQTAHFHENHLEIYFSEHRIGAHYQTSTDSNSQFKILENGGTMIFGPGVTHHLELFGLTMVIEVPSVNDDKKLKDIKG